jgi:transcriptional regulator with XRE-family HTH domain
MDLKYAVGDTIRKLRQEQNLTLRKVSPYVSIGHLSDIELGNKEPSSKMLEAIAEGLNISTAELFREIAEYLEEHNV